METQVVVHPVIGLPLQGLAFVPDSLPWIASMRQFSGRVQVKISPNEMASLLGQLFAELGWQLYHVPQHSLPPEIVELVFNRADITRSCRLRVTNNSEQTGWVILSLQYDELVGALLRFKVVVPWSPSYESAAA